MVARKVVQKRPSSKRKKYRNPPIAEAVCEFQFADSHSWNITSSGLMFEKVRAEYGEVPREQRVLRVMVPDGSAPTAVPNRLTEITKVEFSTADHGKKITVGPGVCAAHVMKPYPGWEAFRPQIADALGYYSDVCEPKEIRRIGLRFINHIFFPVSRGTPDDFFTEPPRGVGGLNWPVTLFNLRHEYSILETKKEQITAIVSLVQISASEDKFGCLLDIDLIHAWKEKKFSIKEAMTAVDGLRKLEREAFEALITNKAREFFNG